MNLFTRVQWGFELVLKVFNNFGQNKNKFDLAFGLNNVCKQNNLQVEIDVRFDKISRGQVASTKILGFTLYRFGAWALNAKEIRPTVFTLILRGDCTLMKGFTYYMASYQH